MANFTRYTTPSFKIKWYAAPKIAVYWPKEKSDIQYPCAFDKSVTVLTRDAEEAAHHHESLYEPLPDEILDFLRTFGIEIEPIISSSI